jgi:hypothetical protein
MMKNGRAAIAIAACIAVFASAAPARAAEESESKVFPLRFVEGAFDVMILRPLSAAALVAGSVFFVASLPLVTPYEGVRGSLEGVRGSWSAFVYAPYEYTVLRDLGDF